MPRIDIVVVTYNSRDTIRDCVARLTDDAGIHVIVVDNASPDDSLDAVADLPLDRVAMPRNGGFAYGCNAGLRRGAAEYVMLLNPDARIAPDAAHRLADVLDGATGAGAVAPRIVDLHGAPAFSQRRFPSPASTIGWALFLHRLFPKAGWTDGIVRDPRAYATSGSPDWVAGACVLVRREALERIGGLDEGFFLYREDVDLCRRLRDAGYDVRFEPSVLCQHEGGASAPRADLLPVLAASRIRYARKHGGRSAEALERVGLALGALTHALVTPAGAQARRGHLRALQLVLGVESGVAPAHRPAPSGGGSSSSWPR